MLMHREYVDEEIQNTLNESPSEKEGKSRR